MTIATTTLPDHPHRPPSRGAIVKAYARTLHYSLRTERWLLVALYVLVVGITGLFLYGAKVSPESPGTSGVHVLGGFASASVFVSSTILLVLRLHIVTFLLAVALAFRVWRSEPPSGRGYHQSLPARRGEHALLRVAAGWTWLAGGTALSVVVFALLGATAAKIAGAIVHAEPSIVQITAATVAEWVPQLPVIGAMVLVESTVIYLLCSAFVVGTERPALWLGALIITCWLVPTVLTESHLSVAADMITQVWRGRLGLWNALFGDQSLPGATWLSAAALWIGIGTAAVAGVAYGRRT